MNVLFVTSRFPYPCFTGDRLRAYIQIKSLATDHCVTLVCPRSGATDEHLAHVRGLCAEVLVVDEAGRVERRARAALALLANRGPLQVAYFHSKKMADVVERCIATGSFDVAHVHLVRCAEYVRTSSVPTKIIDMCDSLALEYARRSKHQRSWLRWLHALEAERLMDYERRLASEFDRVIMISPTDAASLEGFDNVDVLVNSVDASERTSRKRIPNSIMFTGYIGFYSDEMAVTYFHERVLPIVLKTVPDAHFYIVGAEPSGRVRAMAGEHVTVTGYVDSMSEYLARAVVSVSPMLVGAGLKNKILEAMIHRVPVVTTSLANEGIGAVRGESVLIGDTPEEFAANVIRLLTDPEHRKRVGEAGRKLVVERFSSEVVTNRLREIYDAACRRTESSGVPGPSRSIGGGSEGGT